MAEIYTLPKQIITNRRMSSRNSFENLLKLSREEEGTGWFMIITCMFGK